MDIKESFLNDYTVLRTKKKIQIFKNEIVYIAQNASVQSDFSFIIIDK